MAPLPLLLLLLLLVSAHHGHLLHPNGTRASRFSVRQVISADSLIFDLEQVADSVVLGVVADVRPRPTFGASVESGGTQSDDDSDDFSPPKAPLPGPSSDALLARRAASTLRECLVDLDDLMERDERQGRPLSRQLRRVLRSTSNLIEFTLARFDRLRKQRTGVSGGRDLRPLEAGSTEGAAIL